VREVTARRYAREGSPEITADVFDMGDADGAFGAFHHDVREGEPAGIGRESEAAGATLAFWKGRYFVSILAAEEADAARDGVLAIGRAIADAIPDDGEPPALLRLLPATGREIRSVRFVPVKALLDRYYFLADEDLLELDGPASGILAAVVPRGAPAYRLLVVSYPGAEAAARAGERFRARYLHDADGREIARTEGSRFTGLRRIGGRVLALALDAPSREEAESALDEVDRLGNGETP